MSSNAAWIGKEIGDYRIVEHIGDGGMATIYRAEQKLLGHSVAIKILNPTLSTVPEIRERFLQEARIQIALQHNNIVRVLNAYSTDEYLALVLELVEGQSLDKVIKRRGKLPADEAVHIMKQVLDGVGYAHSKGVIHRDLKPSNILVCADGTAKVTDFGIAKVLGDTKLTRTGTSMGSPDYMSPEQVKGLKDIDHRTDIYSLGATLYEMLTERPPFVNDEGNSTDSDFFVKTAHVQTPVKDPRELVAEIPQQISKAILKSLEKGPEKRIQDCEIFKNQLTTTITEGRNKSLPIALSDKKRQFKFLQSKRQRILAILSSTIVLAGIAAIFLAGKQNREGWFCSLGFSNACLELARMHQVGMVGEVNSQLEEAFAKRACDLGNGRGCMWYAILAEEDSKLKGGAGIEGDKSLYEKACELGDDRGCLYSVRWKEDGATLDSRSIEYYKKSLSLAERGCQKKDARSCQTLGLIHNIDHSTVTKDLPKARDSWKKACDLDAFRCGAYAKIVRDGEGGTKDEELARLLFQRACEAWDSDACFELGIMHHKGKGGAEDKFKAREFYTLACQRGGDCNSLGVLWARGEGGAKDSSNARLFYSKACMRNNPIGCGNLGYTWSEQTSLDAKVSATNNFIKACRIIDYSFEEKDMEYCQQALLPYSRYEEKRYGFDEIFSQLGEEGREFITQLCNRNKLSLCFKAAILFENGIGGSKELVKAAKYYSKACLEMHSENATGYEYISKDDKVKSCDKVSEIYTSGAPLSKDLAKAREHLAIAFKMLTGNNFSFFSTGKMVAVGLKLATLYRTEANISDNLARSNEILKTICGFDDALNEHLCIEFRKTSRKKM
jgi:serine/threonine-protein kinase